MVEYTVLGYNDRLAKTIRANEGTIVVPFSDKADVEFCIYIPDDKIESKNVGMTKTIIKMKCGCLLVFYHFARELKNIEICERCNERE